MPQNLYFTGSPNDEQAYVAWLMMLFSQRRTRRVNFEVQWEEAAAMCWPEYRNSFAFGHTRAPGVKYTEFQVDTAGSIASHRFMAICDALITPYNMLWSYVQASNKDLMKDRSVQAYYNKVTECLWYHRYCQDAMFFSQNQKNWQALGVFGNMGMFVDQIDTRRPGTPPGLSYVATSPGEMYPLYNYQGRNDGFIRHFRWTAREAYGRWGMKIHPLLKSALEKNDMTKWDFLHFVLPNTEFDPLKIFDSVNGKPWVSIYLFVAGYCIVEKGGYRTMPWMGGRYMVAPEEDDGRGPAQMVLPELKTLNSEKAMFLRQGHKAAEPAYLLADDGLIDLKTSPNAFNYGGLGASGERLVQLLETGQIQVTQEMMAASDKAVQDAFLVSLFPLLSDDRNPQRTAREVIEEANHRGIFLAPTLGGQYGDYVGPMIDRELDILNYLRLLPKPPPALKEAKGEYQLVYCSPLAKAMKGQEIAGYMRTVEMAKDVVQVTGDQSIMDIFDFEMALPEIAMEQFVPARWMAADQKIAAKRKQRAQAQERDAQVKELPGKAAIMKAQAISDKAQAGQNTGGTLSGAPIGQMPMMPGQSQPGGRSFGQPNPQGA